MTLYTKAPYSELMRYKIIGALAAVAVLSTATPTTAQAPVTQAAPKTQPQVSNALRALQVLRSYGYTWTTDAGALKAIKHWQKVNGLIVDGEVGAATLTSLNLPVTVASIAVRLTPPAPVVHPPLEPGDVESIIRGVWPDDLEDHALAIAKRESSWVPTARNSCCYGLFQIHWRAHQAWLAGFGVTSPAQLLDAQTNAEMAYQLYLIDGWRPWNT